MGKTQSGLSEGSFAMEFFNELMAKYEVSYKEAPVTDICKVIYNDPATIIFWTDGTKTVVKYDPKTTGVAYNEVIGFLMAYLRRMLSGHQYHELCQELIKPIEAYKSRVETHSGHVCRCSRKKQ